MKGSKDECSSVVFTCVTGFGMQRKAFSLIPYVYQTRTTSVRKGVPVSGSNCVSCASGVLLTKELR